MELIKFKMFKSIITYCSCNLTLLNIYIYILIQRKGNCDYELVFLLHRFVDCTFFFFKKKYISYYTIQQNKTLYLPKLQ